MTVGANGGTHVLANVRVDGDRTVDIVMGDGRIEAIAPDLALLTPAATRIEGDGLLALPGLVDGHMHLDKTLTGQAWVPHRAGPERMSRIEKEKELRGTLAPVAERAANLVRCCIAHGTTAIRTHVDVDPELGLAHIHAVAEVRDRFAGRIDMQLDAVAEFAHVLVEGRFKPALAQRAPLEPLRTEDF